MLETMTYERKLWNRGVTYVAGIDEAGRGPLAGPVVAASVVFPKTISISGVRDSKQLSHRRREVLMEEIRDKALAVGIGVIDARMIDEINILQAALKAMKHSVEDLSVRPDHLLVDGNQLPDCLISKSAIVQGDRKCFSIAAASIVAKVTRDRMMAAFHEKYPAYGFDRHKGYGTRAHIEAIRQHGFCPIHRRSFTVRGLQD